MKRYRKSRNTTASVVKKSNPFQRFNKLINHGHMTIAFYDKVGNLTGNIYMANSIEPDKNIHLLKTGLMAQFNRFIEERSVGWSPGTLRLYENEKRKLMRFMDTDQEHDILDIHFVIAYQNWMKNIRGNCQNTMSKSLKIIRTIVTDAKNNGLCTKNPFENAICKREPPKRQFLNCKELVAFEKVYLDAELQEFKSVLSAFLFACYTGLRVCDIRNLTYRNISKNNLTVKMQKTKQVINIPLSSQALAILKRTTHQNDHIFNLPDTKIINRTLKKISRMTGINKHVTFHASRHTFATISLNLGATIEAVSKLLGHNDIKVTQIYARILDETLAKSIELWDTLRQSKISQCFV